jgi:RND superfamily putative drug exporter
MPFWSTIAHSVVRHRGVVLAGWLLAGAVLLPSSRRLEQSLDVASRVRGSESAAVEDVLRTRFASPLGIWSALVVTGAPSPEQPDGRRLLRAIVDSLTRVPGVTRTVSWLDRPDTMLVGNGGGTLLLVGLDPGGRPADALVPPLRTASSGLQRALRAGYPNLALRWTGFVAFNHDLRRTGSAEVALAEARALPLTLALLLWAFGAAAAALLPLLAGVTAIGLALGTTVVLTRFLHLSILLANVVTMIGLGLGIDYALLIVSRFRESLAAGRSAAEAAVDAARYGGRTIAISGLAVAIGFGALLGIELDELRSVAVGGLIVTLTSVLIGATLLPALLSWIGPRIEMGRVRRPRDAAPSRRWEAWGDYVTRNPWRVLAVAGLPVLALAAQTMRLRTDIEASDLLPPRMESTQGLRDLQAMGRSAVVASMTVIVDLPAGAAPLGELAWNAVRRLSDWITVNPGVGRVRSLPVLAGFAWNPAAVTRIPAEARRAFISLDGRTVLVDVLPSEHADRHDLARLVRRVRASDAAALTGLPGTRVRVGGVTAFQEDYGVAVRSRRWGIVSLVIGGTLLALFVGFRSVLAAIGVLVIVFQDGHGVRWLGVARPTGGVFSSVPLLVFCIVFGLSMDYEVFLMARVQEAQRRGGDERAAVVEGLARTAGLITSAAAIMIAVFAAFVLGQFVLVKMLGLALAVAVALDATVVRLAIGPALLSLAGDWNWWPGAAKPDPPPGLRAYASSTDGP